MGDDVIIKHGRYVEIIRIHESGKAFITIYDYEADQILLRLYETTYNDYLVVEHNGYGSDEYYVSNVTDEYSGE